MIFGQQDISRGVPFPRIDLVACRNLLIYLKPDLQQTVLDLFAYSLQQTKGYLFLGTAETARPTKGVFELINKKWKIYRCLGGPIGFPAHQGGRTMLNPDGRRDTRGRSPVTIPANSERIIADADIALLRRVNETILRSLTSRRRDHRSQLPDHDYQRGRSSSARNSRSRLRSRLSTHSQGHAISGRAQRDRSAFREHTNSTLKDVEFDQTTSNGRYMDLTIMTMQVEAAAPEWAMITILDTTETVQMKKRLEAVQREQTELVTQLGAGNKRFAEMNKELQDANEELQAANEELMLTQEELQATNEEFEATNEELQATNEELETNNEEMQATNEELQTTNDELTARTIELHHLMRENSEEQYQLSELLERFPYYVVVVNARDLTILAVNPGYALLLGKREVIGQPLTEFFSGDDLEALLEVLTEATKEGKPITTGPMAVRAIEYGDNAEEMYIHSVVPIQLPHGKTERLFIYTEKA